MIIAAGNNAAAGLAGTYNVNNTVVYLEPGQHIWAGAYTGHNSDWIGGYTAAQGKIDGGWMGVILQFDKEGVVHPHYIDLIPAQREFQILLAAANLKLNAGLGKLG
jgi:hypothetical protein